MIPKSQRHLGKYIFFKKVNKKHHPAPEISQQFRNSPPACISGSTGNKRETWAAQDLESSHGFQTLIDLIASKYPRKVMPAKYTKQPESLTAMKQFSIVYQKDSKAKRGLIPSTTIS